MSINEVYALFTDANPTIKIGKRKFAELRPKHVLLSSQLPRNVCLCKCHENFIMAVNSLNKVVHSFPQYDHHLPEKCICESATEKCWFNECRACKDDKDAPWHVWKKMLTVSCARWRWRAPQIIFLIIYVRNYQYSFSIVM